MHLSGLEVDQMLVNKVDKWRSTIPEQKTLLQRSKAVIEQAMTKKIGYDTAQKKLFDGLGDLEQFLAEELGKASYKNRAAYRSLDKF